MTALAELPAVADAPSREAALALVEERLGSPDWQKIEQIDAALAELPAVEMPLNHVFTPGLYLREIFMPKGTLLTSRIHLTEHPFIISAGVVSVWDNDRGWVTYQAPYSGVTKAGTRRVLYIHEDTVWSTCHANPANETDPDKLVLELTYTGGKFAALGAAAANQQLLNEGTSQ